MDAKSSGMKEEEQSLIHVNQGICAQKSHKGRHNGQGFLVFSAVLASLKNTSLTAALDPHSCPKKFCAPKTAFLMALLF